MTNAATLTQITSTDMPNICALFELVLAHPDIEQSPALFGGVSAIKDSLHAVWEKLEAIECPASAAQLHVRQPELA